MAQNAAVYDCTQINYHITMEEASASKNSLKRQPMSESEEHLVRENPRSDSTFFPTSIQTGMTFNSLEEVLELIAQDQQHLPNLPPGRPYNVYYRPKKLGFRRVILSCKYCQTNLYLKLTENNLLRVTNAMHEHQHSTTRFLDRFGGQLNSNRLKEFAPRGFGEL